MLTDLLLAFLYSVNHSSSLCLCLKHSKSFFQVSNLLQLEFLVDQSIVEISVIGGKLFTLVNKSVVLVDNLFMLLVDETFLAFDSLKKSMKLVSSVV